MADLTPANNRRRQPPGATVPTAPAAPISPVTSSPVEQLSEPVVAPKVAEMAMEQVAEKNPAAVQQEAPVTSQVPVAPVVAVPPVAQVAETGKPKKVAAKKQTYAMDPELITMLEQASFHKRWPISTIVNKAVKQFIQHWPEAKMPIPEIPID